MKRSLVALACLISLTLTALTTDFGLLEQQDFSHSTRGLDRIELSSEASLNIYLAKGFKGGRRGKKIGPSSKRKDPNQANQGNNKGKEHKINQTESNRQTHEPAEARRSKEQAKAEDKNDQRHGKQR